MNARTTHILFIFTRRLDPTQGTTHVTSKQTGQRSPAKIPRVAWRRMFARASGSGSRNSKSKFGEVGKGKSFSTNTTTLVSSTASDSTACGGDGSSLKSTQGGSGSWQDFLDDSDSPPGSPPRARSNLGGGDDEDTHDDELQKNTIPMTTTFSNFGEEQEKEDEESWDVVSLLSGCSTRASSPGVALSTEDEAARKDVATLAVAGETTVRCVGDGDATRSQSFAFSHKADSFARFSSSRALVVLFFLFGGQGEGGAREGASACAPPVMHTPQPRHPSTQHVHSLSLTLPLPSLPPFPPTLIFSFL